MSHTIPLAAPETPCACTHPYRDHAADGAAHPCRVCDCAAYCDDEDA